MSYKKVQLRSNSIDKHKIRALMKYFALRFTENLNNHILLGNWYECLITRKTKTNHTWSRIGLNKKSQNVQFSRSLPIIMTIFSNRSWFILTTQSKINSEIFC